MQITYTELILTYFCPASSPPLHYSVFPLLLILSVLLIHKYSSAGKAVWFSKITIQTSTLNQLLSPTKASTHMLAKTIQQERIPLNHPWLLLFLWKLSLPMEQADLQLILPFPCQTILGFSASLFGKVLLASAFLTSRGDFTWASSPSLGRYWWFLVCSWLSLQLFILHELFRVYTFHN